MCWAQIWYRQPGEPAIRSFLWRVRGLSPSRWWGPEGMYVNLAQYINVRSLGTVQPFLWHEEEPFAEDRDGGREIILLPPPCTTSREGDFSPA